MQDGEPQQKQPDRGNRNQNNLAPLTTIPSTTFYSVEYPAIIMNQPYPTTFNCEERHPSLLRALASLAPESPPYSSASSGLEFIGQAMTSAKSRQIECRLADACQSQSKGKETNKEEHVASTNSTFRHAIVGDIVDTQNIVCKIRKRTWRRKNPSAAVNADESQTCKEYVVEPLGISRRSARFRTMADFLYDPGHSIRKEEDGERESGKSNSLQLHDALRQMDIVALRDFKLGEEKEDYEVKLPNGESISNLRMPPPALFSKTDFPYPYGFRQNTSSRLVHVLDPDGSSLGRKRYANAVKNINIGPQVFNITADSQRNKAPPQRAAEMSKRLTYDDSLLEKLEKLFQSRPMWSRLALLNQFPKEERRKLQNQKHHISRVCYTINDGCWRDSLVRFGYDPRTDRKSRFYQRIIFQARNRQRQAAGESHDGKPDKHSPSPSPSPDLVDQDKEESQEESQGTQEGMDLDEHTQLPKDTLESNTHIFDGVTPQLTRGNYMLIDIQDEVVRKYIEQTGARVLQPNASSIHKSSGWYLEDHYAKIKTLLEHRMHALITTGRPASHESCENALRKLEGMQGSGRGG